MNDTVNTTPTADVVDAAVTQPDAPTPAVASSDVDVVLNDLEILVDDFAELLRVIRTMQENGFFRYATKATRNTLLDQMLKGVNDIDETTKVARGALRKIKRERVPEELVDLFLTSTIIRQ